MWTTLLVMLIIAMGLTVLILFIHHILKERGRAFHRECFEFLEEHNQEIRSRLLRREALQGREFTRLGNALTIDTRNFLPSKKRFMFMLSHKKYMRFLKRLIARKLAMDMDELLRNTYE